MTPPMTNNHDRISGTTPVGVQRILHHRTTIIKQARPMHNTTLTHHPAKRFQRDAAAVAVVPVLMYRRSDRSVRY